VTQEMTKIRIPIDFGNMEAEWVWAKHVGPGLYCIENIPFFINIPEPKVNYEDIVHADLDEEGNLEFREVIETHGNSTVVVDFEPLVDGDPDEMRFMLEAMNERIGAMWEKGFDWLVAINVPAGEDREEVFRIIDEVAS
jgi:Domain of unknown function (DUF4265)